VRLTAGRTAPDLDLPRLRLLSHWDRQPQDTAGSAVLWLKSWSKTTLPA
jgi:hypothetical protein